VQAADPDVVGHGDCQPVLEPHLGLHHHPAVLLGGLLGVQLLAGLIGVARRRVGLLVVLPVLGPDGDAGHVPRAPPPRQRGGGVDLLGQDVARGAVPDLGADGGEAHLGAPAGVVGDEGEVVEAVQQAGAALHRDPRRRRVRDGEGDAGRGEADGDAGGDGGSGQRYEQHGEDALLHTPPAPGTANNNGHDRCMNMMGAIIIM